MSRYARTFLRVRSWLEAQDGGELRDLTPWERKVLESLRAQAAHLVHA